MIFIDLEKPIIVWGIHFSNSKEAHVPGVSFASSKAPLIDILKLNKTYHSKKEED